MGDRLFVTHRYHIGKREVAHIEWTIYRKILMGAMSHIVYLLGQIGPYKGLQKKLQID